MTKYDYGTPRKDSESLSVIKKRSIRKPPTKNIRTSHAQYGLWADLVYTRDYHVCALCYTSGKHHSKGPVRACIHHIDGDSTNNNHRNMITLCNSCHMTKAHVHINSKWPDMFLDPIIQLQLSSIAHHRENIPDIILSKWSL